MTVMEAVKKFEQLARLCPKLVPNETEKVRRMMKMFRINIAKQVSVGSNPHALVSDCISRAIRAEYWINQDKKARVQIFKAKKEEKAIVKHPQPRQNPEFYSKGQSSNAGQNTRQLGSNKRKGNATSQGPNRGVTLKKRLTGVVGVIIITVIVILCVPNVGRGMLGYVEQGQTPTTFVAKKATIRGTVP
ncbi:hypothetical protein TIFTF001_029703 [Ficus carica]|uniref:Uncharacterized protein n=1 Tax=Ficus carica TaxID=3494 RepID=A0AA88DRZ3_FICCA|nr:hypothetical protein TIFTF001_029703 [Ficus carica]